MGVFVQYLLYLKAKTVCNLPGYNVQDLMHSLRIFMIAETAMLVIVILGGVIVFLDIGRDAFVVYFFPIAGGVFGVFHIGFCVVATILFLRPLGENGATSPRNSGSGSGKQSSWQRKLFRMHLRASAIALLSTTISYVNLIGFFIAPPFFVDPFPIISADMIINDVCVMFMSNLLHRLMSSASTLCGGKPSTHYSTPSQRSIPATTPVSGTTNAGPSLGFRSLSQKHVELETSSSDVDLSQI